MSGGAEGLVSVRGRALKRSIILRYGAETRVVDRRSSTLD